MNCRNEVSQSTVEFAPGAYACMPGVFQYPAGVVEDGVRGGNGTTWRDCVHFRRLMSKSERIDSNRLCLVIRLFNRHAPERSLEVLIDSR